MRSLWRRQLRNPKLRLPGPTLQNNDAEQTSPGMKNSRENEDNLLKLLANLFTMLEKKRTEEFMILLLLLNEALKKSMVLGFSDSKTAGNSYDDPFDDAFFQREFAHDNQPSPRQNFNANMGSYDQAMPPRNNNNSDYSQTNNNYSQTGPNGGAQSQSQPQSRPTQGPRQNTSASSKTGHTHQSNQNQGNRANAKSGMSPQAKPAGRSAHEVLGVGKNATQAQIRAAYKQAALKNHPDKNPDDPNANEKFRAVKDAYDKLSNPSESKSSASEGPSSQQSASAHSKSKPRSRP